MRLLQNKGFTLIELLVVITIIGILAVGGTATYTAQIQKARDSTRMTDLNAIRSGIEQFYQDFSEYPGITVAEFVGTGSRSVQAYVLKMPKDSKSGQTCAAGATGTVPGCDYAYNVANDANGIVKGRYRVSTAFENKGNVDTKADRDGGFERNRFEFGLEIQNAGATTACNRTAPLTGSTFTTRVASTADCGATGPLIIAGN